MLSWIVGSILILIGVVLTPLIYVAIAMGDERGDSVPWAALLGLVPIALGIGIIVWR